VVQGVDDVLHAPDPLQVPTAWALVVEVQTPPQASVAWVWHEMPSAAHRALVPQATSVQFAAQHWLAMQ
jgi:hypothetical protein